MPGRGNEGNILIDGSVQLTQNGDSLRQVLNDWINGGKSAAASLRSRLSVTYNTHYKNTSIDGISSLRVQGPHHEIEQQPLIVPAADAVAIVGVDHQFEILVRALESVHELQSILQMNVVVADAVEEEQASVQLRRRRDD